MSHNPYQKASQAYQKKSDETLTPLQIVVELYKGMIKNTKLAKQYWQSNQLDVMCQYIEKNFSILEALQSNIDLEKGGEDAAFLNRFYTVIFSALTLATSKPDPAAYFDEIISYIQQVHDRWYVLAYPGAALPQAQDQP
ncbi:MAG: flagellar export chaperone FliS [Alphaproteobacteria bacterium]|nr:flagellar export chaperone FliS [Alphaproteobacteria bacterium]